MSCKPKTHVYEIYTKDPVTGETGWDIVWVRATRDTISKYPNFDVIITVDDFPYGWGDDVRIIEDFEVPNAND
jgi:hypothetical protein